MRFPRCTAILHAAAVAGATVLAGCATSSNPSHEGMVYIPPTTGTMVGRWVPKSQATNPAISPTVGASAGSISKMQNEGMKNTPSSPSVGMR